METELDPGILSAVRRAIADTRSHDAGDGMAWLLNRRVFRFCRYLRSVVDADTPSRALRPYLRIWYDACADAMADDQGYEGQSLDLTYDDACAQLAYLWDGRKIEHGIADFWGAMADLPEADAARAYDAPHVRKLVSAMYHASQRTPDRTFHLSQADAGRIMGRTQPAGRYVIALLVADGLIEQMTRGHTGKNPIFRWLKG